MATQFDDFTADPFDPAGGEAVPAEMSDSELVSILGQLEAAAIGYEPGGDDEISSAQERALNYYYRQMDDVQAVEGCSSVVDGVVQVVIDNALAALLKPFVSSDETVVFSPRTMEDVEFAEQATEYINYVLNNDNPGFMILHDWVKDALLTKVGIVKVWWEDTSRTETQEIELRDEMHAALVRSDPSYMGDDGAVAVLGQPVEDGQIRIVNVPPEEFRISPMARSIATASYLAHVPSYITRSDLIEMGFDADIVDSLPAYSDSISDGSVRDARYRDENITDASLNTPEKSQDRMALRDEYVRLDVDGDGVSELRRVIRVDDVILYNEPWEKPPFAAWCPVPMPHKFYGLSLADLVIELQKINTVLWRQMLDNLYKSNNPRPVAGEGSERMDGSTADTLMDTAPGAAILLKDINQFRFDAVPYTAGSSLPMLEMVGNMVEERTGVSRAGQGLDSNALRKSGQMTATEMSMIASGKNARLEMMGRIFAETGVMALFKLIFDLVVKHQPRERIIRLRNKFVEVDPRRWPEMDVTISVGLGVGEKGEQIAVADGVLETQAALVQSPYAAMVSPENVYKAVSRKLNAAGIKNVEEYISDPAEQEPQQERPDPEAMKAQAELQMQQQKLAGEQQMMAAKLEMQREEAALKIQLAREEAEAEAQLARDKAAMEAQLAREKFAFEQELAAERLRIDEARAARDADRRDRETQLPKNRPGGELDK